MAQKKREEEEEKCQRLPWRGQCGRAAAGCARAAAALRCQYCAKFCTASYLTGILAAVIFGSGSGRVRRYCRLEKLLVLCLHPRCRGSILRRAHATNLLPQAGSLCRKPGA
jgi:hypothetical protein